MRPTTWVFTFHGVGKKPRVLDPGEDRVWLETDRFRRLLEVLGSRPNVLLTFDDGNRSDAEVALPLLVERGLTASFFVCAGRLGHEDYLDRDQVRALVAAGMTIGSHGWGHRRWSGLGDAELDVEIGEARERLAEAAGVPVRTAACPFGSYDRRVLDRLRAAGYERVYTSDGGPSSASAWLVPRTTVLADHEEADLLALLDRPASLPVRLARSARLAAKRWR